MQWSRQTMQCHTFLTLIIFKQYVLNEQKVKRRLCQSSGKELEVKFLNKALH